MQAESTTKNSFVGQLLECHIRLLGRNRTALHTSLEQPDLAACLCEDLKVIRCLLCQVLHDSKTSLISKTFPVSIFIT